MYVCLSVIIFIVEQLKTMLGTEYFLTTLDEMISSVNKLCPYPHSCLFLQFTVLSKLYLWTVLIRALTLSVNWQYSV